MPNINKFSKTHLKTLISAIHNNKQIIFSYNIDLSKIIPTLSSHHLLGFWANTIPEGARSGFKLTDLFEIIEIAIKNNPQLTGLIVDNLLQISTPSILKQAILDIKSIPPIQWVANKAKHTALPSSIHWLITGLSIGLNAHSTNEEKKHH